MSNKQDIKELLESLGFCSNCHKYQIEVDNLCSHCIKHDLIPDIFFINSKKIDPNTGEVTYKSDVLSLVRSIQKIASKNGLSLIRFGHVNYNLLNGNNVIYEVRLKGYEDKGKKCKAYVELYRMKLALLNYIEKRKVNYV